MASTNVEYYEKQKELQDTINKSEQERLRLDQQLKAYFQSDQRLGKLKAVRLHNYWKKICEDEKRSKRRNEQIRKEFERIDSHMASLGSRTEKLRHLKKQYEEYIERSYPQWKEICQAKMAAQAPQVSEPASQNTAPKEQTDPIAETVARQMNQIKNTKPVSTVLNIRAVAGSPPQGQDSVTHTASAQQEMKHTHTGGSSSQYGGSSSQYGVSNPQQGYAATQPLASSDQPGSDFNNAPHTYMNYQVQQSSPAYASPTTIQASDIIDGRTQVSPSEKETELTGRVSETPRDLSRVSNTQSDSHGDRSEEAGPLPVQNISIQKKTVSSTHATGSQPPPTKVPGMQPEDEDDVSEFGSDVDLPMSDVQAPPPALERQRTMSGEDNSREDSISAARPFTRGSSFSSSKRWSEYGCVKPELTLDGLLFLLKVVQEDFPEAFATDGYYRSYRPDSAARSEIINKANTKSDLTSFDPNQVSMVLLEQLLLVVRSLKEGCLVSDTMLEENPALLTQSYIKQRLSPEGQTLWDGLFNHFGLLLHHKVMEPKEMAAIFVPCIVEDGSLKQDKAYQLIVRLLATLSGDETDDASSQASPLRQPAGMIQDGTGNSATYDGKVPPLKFGSLLEKPLTDDETTSMFSSAPHEKMPLNETDAYKNMLSGTMNSQPLRHHDDEDTDDDVEKQFASALSPRTPRTPASNRSTLNSSGSNQPPKRIAGVKIGSDFDSDSDLDVLKKRQHSEEQDDF